MMILFIAYLSPGGDRATILSQETLADTQAQVMSPSDARAVGFGPLPELPEDVALIACADRDKRRIMNGLEASPIVQNFSVHEIDD